MNPKVSVLMPVYNSEKYLSETIESLLKQTYKNVEYIFIDDCSTDNSYKIMEKYSKKDCRIKLYKNSKNLKLIDTLNKGLKLCTGIYIARMDSDDICKLDRLEKQVEYLEKNPNCVICGSSVEYFGNQSGNWIIEGNNEKIRVNLFFKTQFAHPSVMFRRQTIEQNKITYNSDYQHAEDWKFWIDIIQYGDAFNFKECLLKYRKTENSISSLYSVQQLNTCLKIFNENFTSLGIELTEREELLTRAIFLDDFEFLNQHIFELKELTDQILKKNKLSITYSSKYLKRRVNYILYRSYMFNQLLTFRSISTLLLNYSYCFWHSIFLMFK